MNVTSTGIAVALAVVVALGFLFFGPAVFAPFTPPDAASTSTTTPLSMEDSSVPPVDQSQPLPTELTGMDAVVGTGDEAVAGKTVTVHYVGMLPDGTVFDASQSRGPFTFTLGAGQVIRGWDEGVAGMKVGGKRRLIIPPAYGYGAGGVPGAIPGNATLIFDVELLEVK
jgi:FKBP-type peptidyl-prolyl cis-trans isomerase